MSESGENGDDWIARFRAVLEENNIGWAFWPYKKMDATSCAASFARPEYWDEIVGYAKLRGSVGDAEKHLQHRPPRAVHPRADSARQMITGQAGGEPAGTRTRRRSTRRPYFSIDPRRSPCSPSPRFRSRQTNRWPATTPSVGREASRNQRQRCRLPESEAVNRIPFRES